MEMVSFLRTVELPWIFYVLLFVLGAVLGSFINCSAFRIVRGEDFVKGRSHCPSCGHELGTLDLIPVLSWLMLGGKCRYCGTKISPRYFLTETLCGVCFVLVGLHYRTMDPYIIRDCALVVILLGLSLVDLDIYEIPDGFQIAGIINWLIFLPFAEEGWLSALKSGLLGAVCIGGGILLISLIMDKVLGRESLGGGDVKLLFVVSLYLGLAGGLLNLIVSCIIGLLFVVILHKDRIPFGPSISIATFITLLIGSGIVGWYLGLF